MTETTAVARNKVTTVTINMMGDCRGYHKEGGTVVRDTTDGRYAVMSSKPEKDGTFRLIKVFTDLLHARRYNFAIHGDKLGI